MYIYIYIIVITRSCNNLIIVVISSSSIRLRRRGHVRACRARPPGGGIIVNMINVITDIICSSISISISIIIIIMVFIFVVMSCSNDSHIIMMITIMIKAGVAPHLTPFAGLPTGSCVVLSGGAELALLCLFAKSERYPLKKIKGNNTIRKYFIYIYICIYIYIYIHTYIHTYI